MKEHAVAYLTTASHTEMMPLHRVEIPSEELNRRLQVLARYARPPEGAGRTLTELGHSDWERFVNMDFISRAYDDADRLWRELLRHVNLNILDTLTHGERSTHFIEHVDDIASAEKPRSSWTVASASKMTP